MDTSDTAQTIAENAQAPRRVTEDSTTVEAHPIGDQIQADKYAKACRAASKPHSGLRFVKLVSPGAV